MSPPIYLPLSYGRGSVATASTAVLVILSIVVAAPALVAILATAAPGHAEQRQPGHRGEAQFEESPAGHAAPPLCQLGEYLMFCI